MPVEFPHPLRFIPGELLKSAGEIIRRDGTRIDAMVSSVEDALIKRSPVPSEIVGPQLIQNILNPPIALRRQMMREGLRNLEEAISVYQGHERELTTWTQARLNELLIQRERVTRRLAEIRFIPEKR